MTEQQATEQQASREAHLNTNGRKGNSSSVRSDTQGVAGKTAGSRTYAQMDTRGTIRVLVQQDRASIIIQYRIINSRDGTVRYDMRWRSYREQHRAASADTKIGFVRYDYERDVRLRNDFFGNP